MKDFKQKILNHLEEYIGTKPIMIKTMEKDDNKLPCDIAVFRANNGRPYHILTTIGLSNYRMKGKSKRVELILYLDKNWNLFSSSDEFVWVYKMLQELSHAFYDSKKDFEYGQTFLTRGSNTFSPYTQMNSAILYYPLGLDNDSWSLKLGLGKKIDFFLTTTATYREYALIRKMGGMSFVKNYLLEEGDIEGLVVFNKKED